MHPPELRHLPKEIEYGSLMHALYLFFVGWNNRSGKTAEEIIRQCKEVCLAYPELLDPKIALKTSFQDELQRLLTPIIPFAHVQPERVDWWKNTLKLLEQYDGDPRLLVLENLDMNKDVMEVRSDLIRVMTYAGKGRRSPVGMQHKIAQLILLWLQEVPWEGNNKQWEFFRQIPFYCVDIWVMRLVYQFGMITHYTNDKRDAISRDLSDDLSLVCHQAGISCYNSNQGIWHAGNGMCQHRPKTKDIEAEKHCMINCPVYELCQQIVPANLDNHSRGSLRWDLAYPHPNIGPIEISGLPLREYINQNCRKQTIFVINSNGNSVNHQSSLLEEQEIIAITNEKSKKIRPPKNKRTTPVAPKTTGQIILMDF